MKYEEEDIEKYVQKVNDKYNIQKLLEDGYHIVNDIPMKNPLENLVIKSTLK